MSEDRVVYSSGQFVPESEAKVSIFDSALVFGDMVFEITRSFDRKQFELREYLDRLHAGVKMLRICLAVTPDDKGVHALIPSQRIIPANMLEPKTKNRSRLHYLMANPDVSLLDDPAAWALLMDPDGFLAEGTGSNFFLVKNGEILTPEPRNILRGTPRMYTDHLPGELCIPVRNCNLDSYAGATTSRFGRGKTE